MSVEEALARRRSCRSFGPEPLTRDEVGQLLWSAQGITSAEGLRAAPSAMAAYPLELYVADAEGVFHYDTPRHALDAHASDDPRPAFQAAAHDQEALTSAPAVFVFTAVRERTRRELGDGADAVISMDLGHAAENLLLQAVALGLGAVPIAAFDPRDVARTLSLPEGEVPLYLVPVGHPE